MTRLWLLSDLHIDVCDWQPPSPPPEHDVVVIAGDVRDRLAERVLPWLSRHFGGGAPVVYVPGNHDFWRTNITTEKAKAREIAASLGITLLLDGETAIFAGVRIIGGTLWTDYELDPASAPFAKIDADRSMNDHRFMRVGESYRKWRTADALAEHRATRDRIAESLSVPFEGSTVVVTHHAPHERSTRYDRWSEALDAAYASDLTGMMTGPHAPDIWVHGHVHVSRDYRIGKTRVVANPRGYVERGRIENPDFDPQLVLSA